MIKEVNEIPKPNCKSSKPNIEYRSRLNRDIKKAYEAKIKMFEFTRYNVKPNYLVQAAKSETYNVCKELIYIPAKAYAIRKLRKEFPEKDIVCYIPGRYFPNQIIKIHGVTLEDGVKHVYCEIDYKAASRFKKEFLEMCRYKTQLWIERH